MYHCASNLKEKHLSSVNCLEFSDDGSLLASGDDDGLVWVFQTSDVTKHDRYQFAAPVTALAWAPGSSHLYIGLADCELHVVFMDEDRAFFLDFSPEGFDHLPPDWRRLYQITSLSLDPTDACRLAIGVGTTVIVVRLNLLHHNYKDLWTIPSPNPPVSVKSPAPESLTSEVRTVQFIDQGIRVLVTYLQDGIRCYHVESQLEQWTLRPKSYRVTRSCANSQGTRGQLICHNAFDGFDLYDLTRKEFIKTLPHPSLPGNNVSIPALFVHQDRDVLLGSASGTASIVVVESGACAAMLQETDNQKKEIIQAIAYSAVTPHTSYIATACAEQADRTYVKIWHLDRSTASAPPQVTVRPTQAPARQVTDAARHEAPDRVDPPSVDRLPKSRSRVHLDDHRAHGKIIRRRTGPVASHHEPQETHINEVDDCAESICDSDGDLSSGQLHFAMGVACSLAVVGLFFLISYSQPLYRYGSSWVDRQLSGGLVSTTQSFLRSLADRLGDNPAQFPSNLEDMDG